MQVAASASMLMVGTSLPTMLIFSSLPMEMARYCFGFLTAKELCGINLVCAKWLEICESMDDYWKDLLRHYIPKGLRLSSSDSFLQTSDISWKGKYKMLTTSSKTDVKFVFVGDRKVGKTSSIHKYMNFKYPSYLPTIHDTYSTRVSLGESVHNISIWDTTGDEEYDRLRPLSYMKCDVACIVFSHDDYHSFSNVTTKWYPEIRTFIPDASIILVGVTAKSNRAHREVDPSEIKAMLKRKGVKCYLECDTASELCLNNILEEGLRETVRKAAKRKRTILSYLTLRRKKHVSADEVAPIKHLHYGVHNSHVGKNTDTGLEEMWMLTQAPNRVTTVLYIAY